MNKVLLIGNLTKDPETKSTNGGHNVTSFSVAVNRRVKNADGTTTADYINITAWNQLGELAAKYLRKGRKCSVVGRLQTRTYDAQDGSKRTATEVIAEEIDFLPSGTSSQTAPANPSRPTEMEVVNDEEMPF